MTDTATFKTWMGMNIRCHQPTAGNYKRYGGKGITVCDRWRTSFENFLADMGERPEGGTIDRIDNAKGYSPENCRWATPKEQCFNRGTTNQITYNGETLCLSDWARRLNITSFALKSRIENWGVEKALSTPPKANKRRKADHA
jgi:hypothetical protein